jgi:hypothetical protein
MTPVPQSTIARALESLAGPWLGPLASFLRLAALLALAAVLASSLLRALQAALAWRYGWERRTIVRCPRCGRIAAERERPVCPEGHEVRFPPWETFFAPPRSGKGRAALHVYALGVAIGTGLSAAWGFVELRPGSLQSSLGEIFAAGAYLFFAAALLCASWAIAPGPRGGVGRVLHVALAAVLVVPAGASFLLADLVVPPARVPLGSIWRTPAATYLAPARRRGRRVGPSSPELDAALVEARIPALGIVWQGLEVLRLGGQDVPWKGSGGSVARTLARWAGPLSEHGVWLSKSQRHVVLPENAKLWIVSDRRHVVFLTEEELRIPEIPVSAGRGPPL